MTQRTPAVPFSKGDIIAFFPETELSTEEKLYLDFMIERYEWLLAHIDRLLAGRQLENLQILDIGPSFQTELLRAAYPPATINSLGLTVNRPGPREHEKHWMVDLNDVGTPPDAEMGRYDLIVMAEVIEHLHTAPEAVFRWLKHLMRPESLLIIQTPNAVALHKRFQMLVGRHPFLPINESRESPSHFRESTAMELVTMAATEGLRAIDVHAASYFLRGTLLSRIYNATTNRLPPSVRAGITVTYVPK